MFEFIRKNNKLLTGLLMLLIIPAFVLGGIELYHRAAGSGEGVASVNGRAITQHEWDAAHRQRVQQLRDAQPGLDASLLDSDFAKYQTLERLVEEYAVMEWIAKSRLFVSDQQVQEALLEIPQIAALRGANGQINTQAYAELLRSSGQTPQSFEGLVRGQLSEQQFMQGIGLASSWQPALLTEQVVKPLLQQREVQVAMFPAANYVAQVKPTDAQLQAWYQEQAVARYSVPEQVDVEYLVLDAQAVLKRHPHTDKELADWYAQQEVERYGGTPETRRARHILIAADEKSDAAMHTAAQQKAEELLKQIKEKPESFSELAQKHSQDPGSAAKGGDLGFFEHKTMVKPFADAAFALNSGEVSGVVKSPFGYHIIRLDDIKPGKVPALQTVRQQVESDFAQERLKQHFASDAKLLAEEVAKDRSALKVAAEKLGLPVQTAQGLTANAQQLPPAQLILTHPNVQKALFAQQALSGKQVSDPITVSPNDVVVLRVTNHVPAHTQAYEAVKAQVQADYVQAKAAELAKAAGQAQLQQGADQAGASFAAPVMVSHIQPGAHPKAVLDAAMRADVAKLPALEGADLGEQGYALVRVLKAASEAEELAAPLRAQYAPAVQQSMAQAQVQAYLNSIKPQIKVRINVPKPAVPSDLQQAAE